MRYLRQSRYNGADGANILKIKRGITIKLKKRTVLRKTDRNRDAVDLETTDKQTQDDIVPKSSGMFVLPGDFIGTTEEFRAGLRTYERMGGIYASATGNVKADTRNRSVSVLPCTDIPPILKKGDVVVGRVVGLREALALVTIAGAKGVIDREIPDIRPAVIHVSNIKRAYVNNISSEFGIFDIVKAKLIDLTNMRLDTSEPEMGVMKAFCSRCRTAMVRNNSKLVCPECDRVETRKISKDYGTGII